MIALFYQKLKTKHHKIIKVFMILFKSIVLLTIINTYSKDSNQNTYFDRENFNIKLLFT